MIPNQTRAFARARIVTAARYHAVTYTGVEQARATELLAAWMHAATEIIPRCDAPAVDPQLADHALALARTTDKIGDRRT